MTPIRFLLDTSALARLLRDPAVASRWEHQITAGLVAICPIIELEVLYTARSKSDRDELRDLLDTAFCWVPMPERVFSRAAEIQADLTARGAHRSAGAVDLLVAATADLLALTLVHYDHDFEQVTAVTGQTMTWLAPPGTLD